MAHLDTTSSLAIRLARVLCITLMIGIHFAPGINTLLALPLTRLEHGLIWLVLDEFGRASVPLLSIVSGFLVTQAMSSGRARTKILRSKLARLGIPLLFWCSVSFVLLLAYSPAALQAALAQTDWLQRISWFTALTEMPANTPLYFLRDLLVCNVVLLALWPLGKHAPALLLGVLLAVYVAAWGVNNLHLPMLPIFIKSRIFIFFLFGVAISLFAKAPPRPAFWLIGIVYAAHLLDLWTGRSYLPQTLSDILHRLAISMLMWRVCLSLATKPAVSHLLGRCEPYMFFMFCSHWIVTILYMRLLDHLGITDNDRVFLFLFLLNYPLSFVTAWLLQHMARHVPVARLLMTGKGPSRHRPTVLAHTAPASGTSEQELPSR
ncbi:acyltransferase [Thioclava sp. FTW29]|uniref:Acyltransferase n=1 Tax=Thioclava litoralis TaxID=3076557 RepID=A0ABZ1E4I6_9RHOB|nr:acyltransferase [Thioclava sp. FTW29]